MANHITPSLTEEMSTAIRRIALLREKPVDANEHCKITKKLNMMNSKLKTSLDKSSDFAKFLKISKIVLKTPQKNRRQGYRPQQSGANYAANACTPVAALEYPVPNGYQRKCYANQRVYTAAIDMSDLPLTMGCVRIEVPVQIDRELELFTVFERCGLIYEYRLFIDTFTKRPNGLIYLTYLEPHAALHIHQAVNMRVNYN